MKHHINNKKTDEELVQMMNSGSKLAFEILYDRYSLSLFQFFYSRFSNKEKAEDFLQNTFLTLFQKGETFDPSRKFSSWIYTIAHNQCKTEFRNLSRGYHQVENFDFNGLVSNNGKSSERMDSSIFSEQLGLALKELSHEQQSSFILRFKHHFSIREISEILRCSEGTTKSRLFYCLKKLAKKLKQFNPYTL